MRRTDAQLTRDRAQVSNLYLKGYTQMEIVERLDAERDYEITRAKVRNDLRQIRKRWEESALRDFHAARAEQLAKLDKLERHYWEAWEESQQAEEKVSRKTEPSEDGDMQAVYVKQEHEESLTGNPAFLRGIERVIDKRCELLGLDAPDRTMNMNIDWNDLTDEQLDKVIQGEDVREVVAEEMEQLPPG